MVSKKLYFGNNSTSVTTLVVTLMLSIVKSSNGATSHIMEAGGVYKDKSFYC